MSHPRDHEVVDGRRPGSERCKVCSWVFPCRDAAYCGHLDCLEFNEKAGKAPRCYLCHGKLTGERNTEGATWGLMELRGQTKAACYCCRDQWARLPQNHRMSLARGYTLLACDHIFADKLGTGQTTSEELQVLVDA